MRPLRILGCVWRNYYGDPRAVNPLYQYFVEIPRRLGHQTFYFDHVSQAALNKDSMNELFLATLKGGGFDLVLIETLSDQFYPEVLDEAKRYSTTAAFNSDDDFRWFEYSRNWAPHFTYMFTTYRHVFEAARPETPNLRLTQWACTGLYDGSAATKDIGLSFVGGMHADRARRLEQLGREVRMRVYGKGTGRSQATIRRLSGVLCGGLRRRPGSRRELREWIIQRAGGATDGLGYEEVNALWARTKISFTPLNLSESQFKQKLTMACAMGREPEGEGYPWGSPFQIKGRVFEMGLSGTMMICDRNPMLEEFFVRGSEYVDFESLEECVEQVRYYLAHEGERAGIARAYYERVRREHLWEHRFRAIASEIGLA